MKAFDVLHILDDIQLSVIIQQRQGTSEVHSEAKVRSILVTLLCLSTLFGLTYLSEDIVSKSR